MVELNSGARRLIAWIESPLQGLNVAEYCHRFGRTVDTLLISERSDLAASNLAQINLVLESLPHREKLVGRFVLPPINPFRARSLVSRERRRIRSTWALDEPDRVDLLVGEYRARFPWALSSAFDNIGDIVVVDDGTSALRIRRSRQRRASRTERAAQWYSRAALASVGLDARPPGGLTFFTSYDGPMDVSVDDVVITNDYRALSPALVEFPVDDQCVYVIGTPLLEAGILSCFDIELALELIATAERRFNLPVRYFAHRRERKEKLTAIEEHCEVVHSSVPFELLAQDTRRRPYYVVGFFSSLFVNLARIYQEHVSVTAYELPVGLVTPESQDFVSDIYSMYRSDFARSIGVLRLESSEFGSQQTHDLS